MTVNLHTNNLKIPETMQRWTGACQEGLHTYCMIWWLRGKVYASLYGMFSCLASPVTEWDILCIRLFTDFLFFFTQLMDWKYVLVDCSGKFHLLGESSRGNLQFNLLIFAILSSESLDKKQCVRCSRWGQLNKRHLDNYSELKSCWFG